MGAPVSFGSTPAYIGCSQLSPQTQIAAAIARRRTDVILMMIPPNPEPQTLARRLCRSGKGKKAAICEL
jgi:hypothetical protein